jgi:hypothetical protein
MEYLHLKTLASAMTVAILASACAAEDGSAQAPSAETESTTAALGVCPSTTALKIDRQKKAGDMLAYILGDDSRVTDAVMRQRLGIVRNDLRSTGAEGTIFFIPAPAIVSPAPSGVVCGLSSAFIRIGPNPASRIDYSSSLVMAFDMIASRAEQIWPGIAPFLHTSNCTGTSRQSCTIDFDPEPAQLGVPLSGSVGTTASAAYVNSGAPVTARKWTSTYSSCSANCPTILQPCSISNQVAGASIAGIIDQAPDGSSRYRCIAQ